MKDFITYSPAMLKTFEQCKRKFEYKYIKNITMPVDTSKMQQGKNLHAMANYFLKNYNTEIFENTLTQSEKVLWQNLKTNKYFQYEYVNSEYSLTAKIDKYWINGRLDALVKNKNDYFILDYKTGKIPNNPEDDYQTIIYLLIIDKALKNYDNLSFIYIDLKNNKTEKIDFDEDKKLKYQKRLLNILEEIDKSVKLTIYNKNNDLCRCEYSKICNF